MVLNWSLADVKTIRIPQSDGPTSFTPKRSLVRSQYRPPSISAAYEPVTRISGNGLFACWSIHGEQMGSRRGSSLLLPRYVGHGLAAPRLWRGGPAVIHGRCWRGMGAVGGCRRVARVAVGRVTLVFRRRCRWRRVLLAGWCRSSVVGVRG